MIENVVGFLPLPLGIAVNFFVNDKDYLIPMAIEEPSVGAGASHAAKMARAKGGFKTSSTEPIMIGQVQLVKCPSPRDAEKAILSSKQEILSKANQQDPTLVSKGGGAKDLRVRILPSLAGTMVIAELLVDCRDAMGANVVNTMADFFFQAEDGIRGRDVTGVQTCALPISRARVGRALPVLVSGRVER